MGTSWPSLTVARSQSQWRERWASSLHTSLSVRRCACLRRSYQEARAQQSSCRSLHLLWFPTPRGGTLKSPQTRRHATPCAPSSSHSLRRIRMASGSRVGPTKSTPESATKSRLRSVDTTPTSVTQCTPAPRSHTAMPFPSPLRHPCRRRKARRTNHVICAPTFSRRRSKLAGKSGTGSCKEQSVWKRVTRVASPESQVLTVL